MNPETQAWNQLRERAAAQLPANFADRVLRAARAGIEAAPSLLGHFVLSAATVALCLAAIAFFQTRTTSVADDHALADWRQIASTLDESGNSQ